MPSPIALSVRGSIGKNPSLTLTRDSAKMMRSS